MDVNCFDANVFLVAGVFGFFMGVFAGYIAWRGQEDD